MKFTTPKFLPIHGTLTMDFPLPVAVMPSTENSSSARTGVEISSMSSGRSLNELRRAPGMALLRRFSKNLRWSSGFMWANALR